MKIIITMAGEGSRFSKAGYDKAKHEIEVKGKSLFEWSMISLSDFFDEGFVFIKQKGVDSSFIIRKCKRIGIDNFKIIELDRKTSGQAESALEAAKVISSDEEIIIYNIDTYVEIGEITKEKFCNDYDGIIPVFRQEGDHWSFIQTKGDRVIKVVEKVRISDLCTIGLYHFKKLKYLQNVYNKAKKDVIEKYRENYIAPFYNYMINDGLKLSYFIINTKKVHCLGTPKELNDFKKI